MKNTNLPDADDDPYKKKRNSDTKKLADKIGPVNKNRLSEERLKNSKKESFFNKADKKKTRIN